MAAMKRFDYLYTEYNEAQLYSYELRLTVVCSSKDKLKRECCV